MTDARLRTVETELLGTVRHGDVDGWQIPGLYLDFLRGGEAWPLVDVLRHNREDVRSLARLLGKIDVEYADPAARPAAPPGDLAGLARAFARERRLEEALSCLDSALASDPGRLHADAPVHAVSEGAEDVTDAWWSPNRPPDIGGRLRRSGWEGVASGRLESPWTEERIVIERGRLLRRLGRHEDAVTSWLGLASGPGSVAVQAWIEVAKLREHRLADLPGALDATGRAATLAERRRRMGLGDPVVERGLGTRLARLRRRTAQLRAAAKPGAA
jgi:tetratricopeptide (TPR) repeat protein